MLLLFDIGRFQQFSSELLHWQWDNSAITDDATQRDMGEYITWIYYEWQYRWLSARLQYPHCVSNGVTSVLH